jgi:hypothetical protein
MVDSLVEHRGYHLCTKPYNSEFLIVAWADLRHLYWNDSQTGENREGWEL